MRGIRLKRCFTNNMFYNIFQIFTLVSFIFLFPVDGAIEILLTMNFGVLTIDDWAASDIPWRAVTGVGAGNLARQTSKRIKRAL